MKRGVLKKKKKLCFWNSFRIYNEDQARYRMYCYYNSIYFSDIFRNVRPVIIIDIYLITQLSSATNN